MKLKTAIKIRYSSECIFGQLQKLIFLGFELHHRPNPSPNFVFHTLSKASISLCKNYGFLRHFHFLLILTTKRSGRGSFQDLSQKETKEILSCLGNFERRLRPHWTGRWTGCSAHSLGSRPTPT